MRRLLWGCTFALSFLIAWQAAADQFVHGYYRSNGTFVQPHYRSSPNGTVTDNYSYQGNRNPHTGSIGTNYYRHDLTSSYYTGPDSHGHVGHGQYAIQYNSVPQLQATNRPQPSLSLCPPPYRMTARDGCQQ
jgi:hypothetical protein